MLEGDNIKDNTENEERTALEDVFRFDSEMREEEDDKKESVGETVTGKSVSVEDLNDALKDETDDSEADEGVSIRRRRETSETDNEDFKECQGASGSCLSSSYPDTTSASESSVSNSPNPRQVKSKGKKGKKKRR